MEAVVGAVQIEIGVLVVGALIVIVPKLVVDGDEVVAIDLGAHLDAQIVLTVDIPGRCVADDLAAFGADDLAALIEGRRKRIETQ